MPLKLSAILDRPLVTPGSTSECYLMLSAEASPGSSQRLPLNLALAIDASGSMAGEKLRRVQEAATYVVRQLTAADRVAIVSYSDGVRIVAPSMELTSEAKSDLLWRLDRIEADGMTNLSGGWLTACQGVAKHQGGEGQLDRVLLLTDGLANRGITDQGELIEHARQLRLRGITTSTMGVGVDFNEELLEAMARHGGGRFQYVETAKAIPDCVGGELGELLEVAARSLALEISLPPGVSCVECLNEYVMEDTSRGVRVHLGDLLAGNTRRVMLKLRVAVETEHTPLTIRGLALFTDTESMRGAEEAFPQAELRPAEGAAVDGQPADGEVERELALLLAARAKEEASRLGRRGEHAAAASALGAASHALRMGAHATDPTVASEISALMRFSAEARDGLGERQLKELRYQSYLRREARSRYDEK